MEDKIEIILYLILGLGALLGNIYRSYSKKKQEEERKEMARRNASRDFNPQPSRPKASPVFPDLETLLGIPKQEPKTETDYTETRFEFPEEETGRFQAKDEGEAVFNSTKEELITDNLLSEGDFSITEFVQQNEVESQFSFAEEREEDFKFDPLQAVLYSEILKRPNY